MYSKYGEISVNVKNLRTCSICYERPIFFSDADLRRHERNFHHSYQEGRHEDLKAIRSQLPILTNLLSRHTNPDQSSFYNNIEENSKFTKTEIFSLKRRMVALENEITGLKKSCTAGKCLLPSIESMCSSCIRFESRQQAREEEETLSDVDGQTLKIGMLQKELANTTREARHLQEERSKDKQKWRKIKALLDAQQQKIKQLEEIRDAQKDKIEIKNKFKTVKQKFIRIKSELDKEHGRKENHFSNVADDARKEKLSEKLKLERTEDKGEIERIQLLLPEKGTFLTQQHDNASSFPAVKNKKEECPLDSSPTQKSDTLENELGKITKNEKVPTEDLGELVEKLENKKRNEELPKETISFSTTVQSFKTTTVARLASRERERKIAAKLSQKEKEIRGARKSLKSHDKQLTESLSVTRMLKEEKQHLSNQVIQMENERKRLFESKANFQLKFDELNDKYNEEVKKGSKHEEDLKKLKEVEQELCEVKQEKKLVEGREKELLKELSQLTNNMKQQRERFELRLKAVNIHVEDLEKELASRKGKFKNAEKEINSLTLEDRNILNDADHVQKFNKEFTFKQLSKDLEEERQMVKDVENKNKGCTKTIKELETKLFAKNKCLEVANKKIEELSADLKQIKMNFEKEHKKAKKVASTEADKSEDNVSNCSKQLFEVRKNLNEARKQIPKGQTSYKKDVAEDIVTDLHILNKDHSDDINITKIKDLKSFEDSCLTLIPTPLQHQCGKLAPLSPSEGIVKQMEINVEEENNTMSVLIRNQTASGNLEIRTSQLEDTESELSLPKENASFLNNHLAEFRKDLSKGQPNCQSADNGGKDIVVNKCFSTNDRSDNTKVTEIKDMKSFEDSCFTLLPTPLQHQREKLAPLSPSESIVNQMETKVEKVNNTMSALADNEVEFGIVEIKFTPYQETESELDPMKENTSFLIKKLTEMRKDVDKDQTDLSEEQSDCQSADNSEKDKTIITELKDIKSFEDISYFTLLSKSSLPYNKLAPLPTLNHSSVFDLPPLPTAGSSSILMDKDFAVQEYQPLGDCNNRDGVNFDGDDIVTLLAGADDLETERASEQQKQFFQRT